MRQIQRFMRESQSEQDVNPDGGAPNELEELDDNAFCE
jgi:hypothetical protein